MLIEGQIFGKTSKPTISQVKQCNYCKRGDKVPQPEDVPEPLRDLTSEIIEALRPLDVDTGNMVRAPNGYRVHTAMISFAWAAKDVKRKIKHLDTKSEKRVARKALEYLLSCDGSAYKDFVERHRQFLEDHSGKTSERQRKRPLRFLEERGLECALWPHLYWRTDMCQTYVRAEHRAAKKKYTFKDLDTDDDKSGTDSDNAGAEDSSCGDKARSKTVTRRTNVKQSWLKKVLSPIIGYAENYELLHFVYDLTMWTTIGVKKNLARYVIFGMLHDGICLLLFLPSTEQSSNAHQATGYLNACRAEERAVLTIILAHATCSRRGHAAAMWTPTVLPHDGPLRKEFPVPHLRDGRDVEDWEASSPFGSAGGIPYGVGAQGTRQRSPFSESPVRHHRCVPNFIQQNNVTRHVHGLQPAQTFTKEPLLGQPSLCLDEG